MYSETRQYYDWASLPPSGKDYLVVPHPANRAKPSLTVVPNGEMQAQLRSYGMSKINTEVPVSGPFGYFVTERKGSPSLVEFDHVALRKGVKTPNFKARCATGEIIINPYTTYFGYISADPVVLGSTKNVQFSTSGWCDSSYFNLARFYNGKSPFEIINQVYWYDSSATSSNQQGMFKLNGKVVSPVGNSSLNRVSQTFTDAGSFSDLTDISVSQVLADITTTSTTISVDDDVVMEALEYANKGDLDVLTALAELPETFQSIIDGFKLLKKIFGKAEAKTILLHSRVPAIARAKAKNAHVKLLAQKRKNFPPYEKWIRRNRGSKDTSVLAYNTARNDYLENFSDFERFYKRKEKLYQHQARLEVADAIASVHLNARYNIATTVYTLQDIGDTILNYGLEFKRYRGKKESAPYDFSMWKTGATFDGENRRTERCFIKRQYDVSSDLKKLGRALMTDVIVTGYELIKLWSIIADWFFNIGNCLRAINWNPQHLQQNSCYSVKTEINGVLSVPVTVNGIPITCKAHVTFNGYKRIKINPSDSIIPKWKPDFSLIRQIDALAFFWSSNRGTLKNYYSR